MTELELLKNHLSDKYWRLTSGKLYFIKDKNGKRVPFIPNDAQIDYLNRRHTKNIILKARQLWFTTLAVIDELDDVLFSSYKSTGIIAQDKDKQTEIFDEKVKFAYDNLPDWLKKEFVTRIDRQGMMKFENNQCSIQVDSSFRSGTLQKLHISEYGKICAKTPEKAKEIRSGALNAIWPSQQCTIESTAEWASGDFYDKTMIALAHEEMGTILTDMDYKFFFYPWFLDKEYTLDADFPISSEIVIYFNSIKEDTYIRRHYGSYVFTEWQMRWYQKKKEEQKGEMKREYPSSPKEAFELAIEWAYYHKEMTLAREQWRVTKIEYDPQLPVHTFWDLWWSGSWSDETSIWFAQFFKTEIRLIDYFEVQGMSMREIVNFHINPRGYKYGTHYLPHDANHHEYTIGGTKLDRAKEFWLNAIALKIASIASGIDKVREIFHRCYFDESKCWIGITHLNQYSKKYNKSLGMFTSEPEHDEHSHCADAFRYLAMSDAVVLQTFYNPNDTVKVFVNKITGKQQTTQRTGFWLARR